MDYITVDTVLELREVGFSYPDYEHFLNFGMLFYYQGDEYFIGGFSKESFSSQDKEVAQNGVWLPEASQLLAWLEHTGFRTTISTDNENAYEVQVKDLVNGLSYCGGGLTLANALAKVIKKICKSKQREYTPEPMYRFPICD